jgi:hypothetical protein
MERSEVIHHTNWTLDRARINGQKATEELTAGTGQTGKLKSQVEVLTKHGTGSLLNASIRQKFPMYRAGFDYTLHYKWLENECSFNKTKIIAAIDILVDHRGFDRNELYKAFKIEG